MDTSSIDASMRPLAPRFGLIWTIVVTLGFVLGFLAGLPASWALSEPLVRSLGEATAGALSVIAFTAVFGLLVGGAGRDPGWRARRRYHRAGHDVAVAQVAQGKHRHDPRA